MYGFQHTYVGCRWTTFIFGVGVALELGQVDAAVGHDGLLIAVTTSCRRLTTLNLEAKDRRGVQ